MKIGYNEDRKMIAVTRSVKDGKDEYDYRFDHLYLRGGTWRVKEQLYLFPMNLENIREVWGSYKQDKNTEWTIGFKEAVVSYLQTTNERIGNLQFLMGLKLDTMKKLPVLYKHNNNPPLFANQHIAQYWGRSISDHAMLWEMGTGKTRAAIEIYEIKKKKQQVNHGLVVCPLSMCNKWVLEIEKWSGDQAYPLRGTKEEKLTILEEDWEWLVCTYETFERWQEDILSLVDEKWFVVLDETTKIKNPTAKRSKACHKLGRITKHKTILTGTPVTQNAYDVFSQFLFLDGGETFGVNYDAFIDKYFWKMGYRLAAKYGSLEEISAKMFGKSTRFLKKDCIDIPDKLYDQRLLDMPAYNKLKYEEMVKWAITIIEESSNVTAPVILTQLLRLSQITSGFVKDVNGKETPFKENPKLDALKEVIETSNGAKMVVWARFQYDVEQILRLCQSLEVKACTLYGKDNEQARWESINAFEKDPEMKIIIGTAGTGGHGIDLVAGTIVVYFSNSYSLEQRLQSEDRSHRAGQVNQVTYIDLLMKDTIDVSIYKILRNKKNIADVVTKDNLRSLL